MSLYDWRARVANWFGWSAPPTAAPPIPVAPAPNLGVSREAVMRARRAPPANATAPAVNPFTPYKPAKGVVPEGEPLLAMDDASGYYGPQDWASVAVMGSPSVEGQRFAGFPALALLAQQAEFRIISEVISTEMCRKWITFKSLDGSDKTKKIKELEEEFTRLRVRECFQEAALQDGFFGRSHLWLDFGVDDDANELRTSIGDGTDEATNKLKIKKDSLIGMRVIEPAWVYPQSYNATNPLKADWYKPIGWYVMGKTVDASRLLTFIGRDVPDMLKPAYAFAGLSMSQMALPYVTNWVDVRKGVTDIIEAFSVFVLSTNATDILAGGSGETFLNRLDFFNATRDNRGVLGIDKDKEDFKNVSAPLGGLDKLQAQSQEHICAVSRLPLVKYTGISPSGLNATTEGELQVFADHIRAYQEHFFRPNLTTVLRIVQLSKFGEVDHKIGFEFGELIEATPEEEAALRKTDAETGAILVSSKAVSSAEERARIVKDAEGPYQDLNPDDEVTFPMTENEKATTAGAIATTVATLVSEGIIDIPLALRELKNSSEVTGFGTEIDDDMIEAAEEAAAAAPDPSELMQGAGGAEGGEEGDPEAAPAAPAGAVEPVKPAATSGVHPLA